MIISEVFEVCKKNDLQFIQIPAFADTGIVNHCFSTRLGGVSSGIYESMNLGFNRGDSDENVINNFKILCDGIDVKPDHMVLTNQVHEDQVVVVCKKDCGKGYNRESDLMGVDGFVTDDKGVALVTFYADCVPLYFLDPVNKVIGLSHAGWRGTVKKIGAKTVRMMQEVYGSRPEDLLGAIGPSIGACCFEVSEDVKIEVEKSFNHDIIDKIVKGHGFDKYLIDLWTANEVVMIEAGMRKEHITKTDVCTMCHKSELFSHRGSDGKRGSMVAIMELR